MHISTRTIDDYVVAQVDPSHFFFLGTYARAALKSLPRSSDFLPLPRKHIACLEECPHGLDPAHSQTLNPFNAALWFCRLTLISRRSNDVRHQDPETPAVSVPAFICLCPGQD